MDITKFRLAILDIDSIIYKKEVKSVFIPGDQGEFELLPCHYPLLSLLKEGDIIINWEDVVSVKRGIVKFLRNDCVIVVEMAL